MGWIWFETVTVLLALGAVLHHSPLDATCGLMRSLPGRDGCGKSACPDL